MFANMSLGSLLLIWTFLEIILIIKSNFEIPQIYLTHNDALENLTSHFIFADTKEEMTEAKVAAPSVCLQ